MSADRPVHPGGDKRGGALPSIRKSGNYQGKSPVRDHPPRRSHVDQPAQDCSLRCSKEREGRIESSYNRYHCTGQQRRQSPKLFGRIHYPSPPKDLSQARLHREFRSPELSRKRRKKSKGSKSRPHTRSRPLNHTFSRRSRSPQREPSRVDYSDLLQQPVPLPETFAQGPATRAPRAEATVPWPDSDIRKVKEFPLVRKVVLAQQQDPTSHRVERKERSSVPVSVTEQPSVSRSIPDDSVPNWFAPMMDKMLTMFASPRPPTETPTVTVEFPVAGLTLG